MRAEPCGKCGRSLLDLRRDATRDALRGSAPLCAIPGCPLVQRVMGFQEVRLPSLELHGPSPPAVFVGRYGYPNVTVGPLLPSGEDLAPAMRESPAEWAASAMRGDEPGAPRRIGIAEILAMRARLFRSKAPARVDAPAAGRALEASREVALSSRPVETEVTLAKPARFLVEPQIDATALPMGPSVDVVDARVLSHPSVPRRVDAVVSDAHADAATGVGELYGSGISPYHIQRLLSVGLLGERERRKLVPTRWSITATDDIIGKQLIEEAKQHAPVDAPEVRQASLFGNHFQIVFLPRVWSFEMVEAWSEGEGWAFGSDREGYAGRTGYVEQVAGAYYAARLSVLEHLVARRRQASVFVYREITEDYWAPLGVWVIREAVRAAMGAKPLVFGDIDSAVRHVARRSRTNGWLRVATLPREAKAQRTLRDFLEPSGADEG